MGVVQVTLVVVAQYAVLDSCQIKVYLVVYDVFFVVRTKHKVVITHVPLLDSVMHDIEVVIDSSIKGSQV